MTRIVCVSDLHENWIDTPSCDLLLVAGDITYGFKHDYASQHKAIATDFMEWANNQPSKSVICIAGNHDQSIEAWGWPFGPMNHKIGKVHYLQDMGTYAEGLYIWGTPWQPWFYSWAFNAPQRHGERFLKEKFDLIPNDTDIIICHGPPFGYGDKEPKNAYADLGYNNHQPRLGSRALTDAMRRVKPKLLVCGHIHQGAGVYDVHGQDTKVVNAAIVNNRYEPVNAPVVIDV